MTTGIYTLHVLCLIQQLKSGKAPQMVFHQHFNRISQKKIVFNLQKKLSVFYSGGRINILCSMINRSMPHMPHMPQT